MKVKRYKLKEGIGIEDILACGFKYNISMKYLTKMDSLNDDIYVYIQIPLSDIHSFDWLSNVDVLDKIFLRVYCDFYRDWDKDTENEMLEACKKKYNELMDSLGIFEVISD